MPLTYRFYRTTVIGDGTIDNPFRSKLSAYVTNNGTGADFWEWLHWARPIRYLLAYCDSTVHTSIDADTGITALSSQGDNVAAVNTWLNQTVASLPQATKDVFLGDGFPSGWVTSTSTRREYLCYISRVHVLIHLVKRGKDTNALNFFAEAINATVGSTPAQARSAIQAWMESYGIDTGWITGSTLVADVVQYIMDHLGVRPLPFGWLVLEP